MKMPSGTRETTEPRSAAGNGINSHSWATKMEIQRFFSGKRDLEIERTSKTAVDRLDQTAGEEH